MVFVAPATARSQLVQVLTPPVTLHLCCQYHLSSPGKCSQETDKLYASLPIEIVEHIINALAYFGSRHALTAALIHPRYTKSCLEQVASDELDFAQCSTLSQWGAFRDYLDYSSSDNITLRYGPVEAKTQGHNARQGTDFIDNASHPDIEDLQYGCVKIDRDFSREFVKRLTLLQGYRHAPMVSLFGNLEELSLYKAGWTSLQKMRTPSSLKTLFFFKDGTGFWPRKDKDSTEDFSSCVRARMTYMVNIEATSIVPYCALVKLPSEASYPDNVKYFTFYCRYKWR
jgi:hypothetical protein